MGLDFLLEIGVEEIPDWMIEPALANLRELLEGALAESRLGGTLLSMDATPRRLAARFSGVVERQADTDELVMGPPAGVAFRDGKPTGAATGFARKMGVGVEDLLVETTAKGEYLACRKQSAGRAAIEILSEKIPEIVQKIYWPKSMYWTGKTGVRFIRPIRWIVALLGSEVVPFDVAGVSSGGVTFGHRRLCQGPVAVNFADYEQKLEENFVLLSADRRRRKIEAGVEELLDGTGLRVRKDDALLSTLVYLTEYPTPILGGFDAKFLALPEEVLVTVMRHHQRYFSVEGGDGKLAPRFLAVMNTSADAEGLVRRGNERVLEARFNDARFFWEFDEHKKLADRVADLEHVTFQAKLGSYLAKTERNVELAAELAKGAGLNVEHATRAAQLLKCDLTTEMVKEFTELQGVVGGLYARAQGEPEEVAQAIYHHYKPESMEDAIPPTPLAAVVALADKLDTLRGCFEVGLAPSGSKDPFALRRAAQGVVRILVEGNLTMSVPWLVETARSKPIRNLAPAQGAGAAGELENFIQDRARYYFREIRGFAYDEVNAVVAAGWDDLADVERRLAAIQAVRPTADFEPLAASFKRIRNILKQASFEGGASVDAALLEPGAEAGLADEFHRLREVVHASRARGNDRAALEAIASLRPAVDLFFDKVLVNAEDAGIRANRLALLGEILSEFSLIADFSEIVTSSVQ